MLGFGKEALDIILYQLVSLVRNGQPVAMSTRSGEFVTLKEVVDEVGKDAWSLNLGRLLEKGPRALARRTSHPRAEPCLDAPDPQPRVADRKSVV